MRISDLKIDGFGVWQNLEVDELSNRLTVFYGPNEAGKTTLMQFVRAVLYGFSPQRKERYVPPVKGGPAGGSLALSGPGGEYLVQRSIATPEVEGVGSVDVIAPDGTMQGDPQLNALLCGMDESIFNNVFAVGLREMQQLGALDDTEAAELLYDLTGGMDRVSLNQILRDLDERRQRILADDDRPSEVKQLLVRREQLEVEIEGLSEQTTQWENLASQKKLIDDEIRMLSESNSKAEQEVRLVELSQSLQEPWHERLRLETELASLGPDTRLPRGAQQRMTRLTQRIERRRRRRRRVRKEGRALSSELDGLKVNEAILQQSTRIEALRQQREWIDSLGRELQSQSTEVEQLEVEYRHQITELGQGDSDFRPSEVSPRAIRTLRGPEQEVRQQRRRLEELQAEAKRTVDEAQQVNNELAENLLAIDETELIPAMERAGTLATNLRRRIQVDERLEQLERQRGDLEEQTTDLLNRQILPLWVLGGLGGVFALGVVLICIGIFWPALSTMGWALAGLGVLATGCSAFLKIHLESVDRRRLEECRRQEKLVASQLEQTKSDRDELDKTLPVGGGPISSRAQAAEDDLKSLESLLPLDARSQALTRELEAANGRVTLAEDRLKQARRTWRQALVEAGLPRDLSPKQARSYVSHYRELLQTRKQIDTRQEDLQRRQREWDNVSARVEQLIVDVNISIDRSLPIGEILQVMADEVSHVEATVRQQSEMRRRVAAMRREYAEMGRELHVLNWKRRRLLADAGTADESEFFDIARRAERRIKLVEEISSCTNRITRCLDDICSEEEIAEFMRTDTTLLEKRQENSMSHWQELDDRLKNAHEQRGRIDEQMNALAADRRMGRAQLELKTVESRLDNALQQWRVYAVTSAMLESVRQLYETQRQPETLREASGYLSTMTDGRYTRIWTPLGEDILYIDDNSGQQLSIDILSRGTREQVYLSLRLALVSSYARRGITLPVILDDVLVNFDAERAQAAATVLEQFAGDERQVLVFTCHEHIKEMFAQMEDTTIRSLPTREENPGWAIPTLETPSDEEEEVVYVEDEIEEEVEDEIEEEIVEELEDEQYEDEEEEDLDAMAEEEEADMDEESCEEEDEEEAEESDAFYIDEEEPDEEDGYRAA